MTARSVSPAGGNVNQSENHNYAELIAPAVDWYEKGHRDLPWRRTRDPYRIWVSEIMLQQTRVEAVISYYERFLTALPTIRDLAECPEDRLLKLWEGLGYYSRVRNLKKAAGVLMEQYDGKMPADHDAILSLPGIGPYTAGAVSSIAFGLPYSAVDGNVLRILTRARCDGRNIAEEKTKKAITREMDSILQERFSFAEGTENKLTDPETGFSFYAGDLNQAMMELGATVCLPNGEPRCDRCPWREHCEAFAAGRMMDFPVKTKLKQRRIEDRTILIIRDGERVLLRKRPEKGLLAGLYEFPGLEGHVSEKEALEYVRSLGLDPLRVEPSIEAKHIFSHVEWHMTSFVIHVAQVTEGEGLLLLDLDRARNSYAIPSAFKRYTELLWGNKKQKS